MKVLFITLSNIGDAVLTMPALSAVLENFKDAQITLVTSPRAAGLFKDDPRFEKVIVYRKDSSPGKKMALVKMLRAEEFDLLADFKNTMFPFLLYAKRKTPIFKKPPEYIKHIKDRHLWRLRQAAPQIPAIDYKPMIWLADKDLADIGSIFSKNSISDKDVLVAVAAGAGSHTKQWMKEGFLSVCERLIKELPVKVILIGDEQDKKIASWIEDKAGRAEILNMCAGTDLKQLAAILKRCALLITNDSGPMHIAWAVQTPVVSIFGPTDYLRYGPQGPSDIIIRKELACSPCQSALCGESGECMSGVSAQEVFEAARGILINR